MFLRPREESARVARTIPPIMQPMKKEEAGRLLMIEPAQARFHSDIIEMSAGRSHDHEPLGSLQTSEAEAEAQRSSAAVGG